MSTGWHKQRALESRMFRRPEPAKKPEPTLDEQIASAEAFIANPFISKRSKGIEERKLAKLIERRRVRDSLAAEEKRA